MRKSVVVLAGFCFFLMIFSTQPSIARDGQSKVVFWGDSITAGEGVPDSLKFTSLIGQQAPNLIIVNQAKAGWAITQYWDHREEMVLELESGFDALALQLGTQDLKQRGGSKAVVQATVKQMEQLLIYLQQQLPQTRFVLVSPPNIDPAFLSWQWLEAGFGEHTNHYLCLLSLSFEALAEKMEIEFVNLFGILSPGLSIDGVNPNKLGHQRIAEVIKANLDDQQLISLRD